MNSIYNLVELILEESFSKEISELGNDLILNGPSTIKDIMKRMKLEFQHVRNSIIVLMQNKLCNFRETKKNSKNEVITEFIYELDVDSVLMRLRFPKILYHINIKFGNIAGLIFEEFMYTGILTSNQCAERVPDKLAISGSNITKRKDVENSILSIFVKLIEKGYLIQCNKLRNQEIKDDNQNHEKKKKNTSKKKKPVENKLSTTGVNETDDVEMKDVQESLIDTNNNLVQPDHPLLFNKEQGKRFFYFINFDKIINELKVEIIEDLVQQKLGNQAGIIISYMLRKINFINIDCETTNYCVSAEEIFSDKEINSLNSRQNLKLSLIKDILEQMTKEEFEFCLKWGLNNKGNETYCLNLESIFHTIKTKTLEKIIEQQYSSYHVRIYRLLSKCGALDTKNIMEFSMISLKETSACLNQMVQENILTIQQINLKGIATNFFMVNTKNNLKYLVVKIYKMILNLKIFLKNEIEKLRLSMDFLKQEEYVLKFSSAINELDETILVLKYFE